MRSQFHLLTLILIVVTSADALAADLPLKLTVSVRGMKSAEDAQLVQKALRALPGVKVEGELAAANEAGPFRHYFSPPVAVELTDLTKSDLGALAEAVAAAKTPSREAIPPSLNLVLYDRRAFVEEADVGRLREALMGVSGLAEPGSGVFGMVPAEARYWVRLGDTNAARLDDIDRALNKAAFECWFVKP